MFVRSLLLAAAVVLAALLAPSARAAQSAAAPSPPASHATVVGTYCVTCHSDRTRTGGLSLEHADLTDIPKSAETWEKVIRKVRVGMMPPPGMPRPPADAGRLCGLPRNLARSRGRRKAESGPTAMHRLNRAEYANAIRDLLALEIDATALLPPDDESSGFDNIADVLTVSPSLMERYLSASWNISRMAVGNIGDRAEHRHLSRAAGPFAGSAHRRAAARHARRNPRRRTPSRSTANTSSRSGCGATRSI